MKGDAMRFAWEQFAAGEKIPGSVRGPIAASWRRCPAAAAGASILTRGPR